MEQRELGKTRLQVSVICMGTMTFGQQNTQDQSFAMLDRALDAGVNFYDAAELYPIPPGEKTYGDTERIVGNWIEARKNRDEVILATKVMGRADIGYAERSVKQKEARLDRQSVLDACDASLKRLKTDYIDLYQVHWPERAVNKFGQFAYVYPGQEKDVVAIEETLSALGELVTSGKVRHIGLSNETPWGISRYLECSDKPHQPRVVSIQNPYNLLHRSYEVGLSEFSIREQVGLLAYSPLAAGMLSGKYLNGAEPAGARMTLFGRRFSQYGTDRCDRVIGKYAALAKKAGMDCATLAHRFVIAQPFVTSSIIGTTSLEQLEVALRAEQKPLAVEVMEEIQKIHIEDPVPFIT